MGECWRSTKDFCSTSFGLVVGGTNLVCVVLFIIGFFFDLAKQSEPIGRKHTGNMMFMILGFFGALSFLYGVFVPRIGKWSYRFWEVYFLISLVLGGAAMGASGQAWGDCLDNPGSCKSDEAVFLQFGSSTVWCIAKILSILFYESRVFGKIGKKYVRQETQEELQATD